MRVIFLFFYVLSFAQQTKSVDFKTAHGKIVVEPQQKKVFGTVTYVFVVKSKIDTIKIDAQKMTFSHVLLNRKKVNFLNTGKTLNIFEGIREGRNTLTFDYEAFPKQTMYFSQPTATDPTALQVWTQGQGKYTSHWFPSFDDVNEKLIFSLQVTFDKRYNVIANGFLRKQYEHDQQKTWLYEMKKPMSSYLLALVIGDFYNKVIASRSGIPLQFFIQPKDTAKFESTYRYSLQIFDFLEREIGFKYPWQLYKQVPIEDFLYAGMENTTCTLFAQDYVVDAIGFNDRNYVNVNAHELAHQWFGNVITAQSGKHHWLQEGFATYYALLAEKEVFGEEYFYHQLYRTSLQLRNAAKTDSIPVMHEKASSLSLYQKGAWALHFMREQLGATLFQKGVKKYLEKYRFKNVQTSDFLNEIKKVAPHFDTQSFQKIWLESPEFPTESANLLLQKNAFMRTLFQVQQWRKRGFEENYKAYQEMLQSDWFYPIKTEIVYQMKDVPFEQKKPLLELALQTNDYKVRQAVAEFTDRIPQAFQSQYESLLLDNSYETREIALIKLFHTFPENQLRYLEQAKNWLGNNDLGLRITYLFLTQFSTQTPADVREKNLDELMQYTSPNFESSVRQNAFSALLELKIVTTVVLQNLVNATVHHKWQMTKFARDAIRSLVASPTYRQQLESLVNTCNGAEQKQLQNLLNEKL